MAQTYVKFEIVSGTRLAWRRARIALLVAAVPCAYIAPSLVHGHATSTHRPPARVAPYSLNAY